MDNINNTSNKSSDSQNDNQDDTIDDSQDDITEILGWHNNYVCERTLTIEEGESNDINKQVINKSYVYRRICPIGTSTYKPSKIYQRIVEDMNRTFHSNPDDGISPDSPLRFMTLSPILKAMEEYNKKMIERQSPVYDPEYKYYVPRELLRKHRIIKNEVVKAKERAIKKFEAAGLKFNSSFNLHGNDGAEISICITNPDGTVRHIHNETYPLHSSDPVFSALNAFRMEIFMCELIFL